MTLKQLKTSLTRLPSDFDDYVVVLATKANDSVLLEHQLLAGVGVCRIEDDMIPVLLSEEALHYQAKNGKLSNPDGSPIDL